ncbi:MAG: DUF5518 domain-containing protein [Candidatus Altiarchaeota archaeon]
MNKFGEYLSTAATLVIGALSYVGLNWIPILGPLAAGGVVGYLRRRGPRDGFRIAAISGVFGALAVVYLFAETGVLAFNDMSAFPSFLVMWIILLWNVVGVLLTGAGGALASMFFHAHDFLERRFDGGRERPGGSQGSASFIICERCGEGVRACEDKCPHCNMET